MPTKKRKPKAIIAYVPQGLGNAIIRQGAQVEILRTSENKRTAKIRIGGLVIHQFPLTCLTRENL